MVALATDVFVPSTAQLQLLYYCHQLILSTYQNTFQSHPHSTPWLYPHQLPSHRVGRFAIPCVCNALRAVVVAAVLARCGVGCYVQTYSYLSYLFSFAPPTTFGTLARSLKFRNRLRVCGCCTVCGARCSCVGCHCVSRSARHLNSTPCSSHYLSCRIYYHSPHLAPPPPLPLSLILLLLFHPRRLSRRSSSSRLVTTRLAAMVQRLCTIQR